MFGTPYSYNPQASLDRINNQIAELEKMKANLQQPIPQPTNLTQNFQISPQNREVIRYADSIEEVNRDLVIGETPYFSRDMSVLWVKNTKGEVKTYELKEILPQDEKEKCYHNSAHGFLVKTRQETSLHINHIASVQNTEEKIICDYSN